jgi:hypothetical protein
MLHALLSLLSLGLLAQPLAPVVVATPLRCDFGRVSSGEPVTCTFILRNGDSQPARISEVGLTKPLTLRRAPAVIAPGEAVTLHVDLDTQGLDGSYEGTLTLRFDGGQAGTVTLSIAGEARQSIALIPGRVLLVAGHEGDTAAGSIEIVNREEAPISLTLASPAPEGTELRIETVEQGRRFRLVLTMNPGGPLGRRQHEIVLAAGGPHPSRILIRAHTLRRARVYTFPESVDLGAIPLGALMSDPARFAQTLMVYQRRGTAFDARFSIDTPAVRVSAERGPNGDRYQATLTYVPGALAAGPIRATLVIETNDPDFARIEVPVRGAVLPSR